MISLNTVIAPLKWIYSLFADRTFITIVGQEPFNGPAEALLVYDQGGHRGELRFGVTTTSKGPLELTRVEVDYAAPLQLWDPERKGFFDTESTHHPERPFRIFWKGSEITRAGIIQMFALIAAFPDGCYRHEIAITVYARRQHSPIGGYLCYGRMQRTMVHNVLVLVSKPLRGFALRAGWSATSPQPFVVEHAFTVSGPGQSVTVNELTKDGTASSTRMKLPEA